MLSTSLCVVRQRFVVLIRLVFTLCKIGYVTGLIWVQQGCDDRETSVSPGVSPVEPDAKRMRHEVPTVQEI